MVTGLVGRRRSPRGLIGWYGIKVGMFITVLCELIGWGHDIVVVQCMYGRCAFTSISCICCTVAETGPEGNDHTGQCG